MKQQRTVILNSSDDDEDIQGRSVSILTQAKRSHLMLQPSQSNGQFSCKEPTEPFLKGRTKRGNLSRNSMLSHQGWDVSESELWVQKHAPTLESELVVHKKKTQDIRQWLEHQKASLLMRDICRVAVITGPSGCGKSTLIRVLAHAVGFEYSEWHPPTPTLWGEYRMQGNGSKYVSKLEAFEEFALRAKLPALVLSKSESGKCIDSQHDLGNGVSHSYGTTDSASAHNIGTAERGAVRAQGAFDERSVQIERHKAPAHLQLPKLVVVEDIPHVSNAEQRRRLAAAIGDMARTVRSPLIIMTTEGSGRCHREHNVGAASCRSHSLHKDIQAVLDDVQAEAFTLNPITPPNTCKVLDAILQREKACLSQYEVQAIAEQSQGDLANAISTLQFVCKGGKAALAPAPKGKGTKRKASRTRAAAQQGAGAQEESISHLAWRDSTLSMFHALGKLLYNKRQGQQGGPSEEQMRGRKRRAGSHRAGKPASQIVGGGATGQAVVAWCSRDPLEFDPEAVILQSGLDAGSVAAYLHENVHNFIDESAIEDIASCMEYISDSDLVASTIRYGGGAISLLEDDAPSDTLADAAGGAIAARGVCFSNTHPAARRWLPLSAPALFLVEKAAKRNREELEDEVVGAWVTCSGAGDLRSRRTLGCELLPYLRCIHGYSGDPRLLRLQPSSWCRVWEGQIFESKPGGGRGGLHRYQCWDGGLLNAACDDVINVEDDVIEESD